jgi:hypothetical protein
MAKRPMTSLVGQAICQEPDSQPADDLPSSWAIARRMKKKKPSKAKKRKKKKAKAKAPPRRRARIKPHRGPFQIELPLQMPLFPIEPSSAPPAPRPPDEPPAGEERAPPRENFQQPLLTSSIHP